MRPKDRKYLKSHEWCLIENGIASIGITDYAVSHLSDLVFLELSEVGSTVAVGEPFGEIESVKAVSDLYSPVSGQVTEANDELTDNLDLLTSDAFVAAWMIRVKVAEESPELMDASEYERQLETEQD